MIYIADYFALGLVVILFMFFFDSKISFRLMPFSSKVFAAALTMTALTALTDLWTGSLAVLPSSRIWLGLLVNSLYFIVNLVTTSLIALYLFVKTLEHTHHKHCMRRAYIGLAVIFSLYTLVVIANIWTGWLFYYDGQGVYCRGPLNVLGYVCTIAQMVLVLICYANNKETASRPIRRALVNVFPVVPVCIVIQRIYPEIMLNSILIAFVDTVLFMTFMSQRHGVHSLTELNDRHRFFEEVDHRIAKQEPFQIFLINLKGFSTINQKFGHLFGDEYLYQFAFSLEKLLKDGVSFHMNGTVFAIVLRYTYQSLAEKQSGILLDFLDRGMHFGAHHIEADYIVSHYVSDGSETASTTIYEIMEYSASKAFGQKHRYVHCTQDVQREIERRKYLRDRLQKIDRAHGFEVWYQPIKCVTSGRFCSMEALIRLREPDGKLISPGEFIPLAEQTGQINSITWFVLEETCRILKTYPELSNVTVSINLPMAQLVEKGFVTRFTGIVDQAGLEHHRICIEFTERTILDTFQQTQAVMQQLTQEGFRFYLDDFGEGYSNFNCLLQLPFQIIKLDAGFIRQKPQGNRNYETIRALTKLFHDMNLVVVAEGAETEEEVCTLAELGVDRIQGYYFARPMGEQPLLEFYQSNTRRSLL